MITYLVHASICEEQSRVFERNNRRTSDEKMLIFVLEKVDERLANILESRWWGHSVVVDDVDPI